MALAMVDLDAGIEDEEMKMDRQTIYLRLFDSCLSFIVKLCYK